MGSLDACPCAILLESYPSPGRILARIIRGHRPKRAKSEPDPKTKSSVSPRIGAEKPFPSRATASLARPWALRPGPKVSRSVPPLHRTPALAAEERPSC